MLRQLSAAADVPWTLLSANRSIEVPAAVPGNAHLALIDAGLLLGDPLYRYNEREWAWAALEDWTFRANVSLGHVEAAGLTALEMEGVDTAASVWVNGRRLDGDARDAFVRWSWDLPPALLRAGANCIEVRFTAARAYARAQKAAYPYEVPSSYYPVYSEPSARNFIRKPPYDFGWDWGPSFMPTGITGAVTLRDDAPRLRELAISQAWDDAGGVRVRVAGRLGAGAREPVRLRVELCYPSCAAPIERAQAASGWATPPRSSCAEAGGEAEFGAAELHITAPRRWWPRGYGPQTLYEVRASLARAGGAIGDGADGASLSRRIGLRTVELVEVPAPPPTEGAPAGTSFFFRVNGVPVFAKGANMIPLDVFETRVTAQYTRWVLERAAAAHMNMVRVWGGGRYQPDRFYDLADELGIMVWQEMMFACAMYPRDAPFVDLVGREVSEQVSRLAHHPSIVIWGGNNENEGALRWFGPSRDNRDLYVSDYVKLYVETVRVAVSDADADGRPFVDSSPSSGLISASPYAKRWGDVQATSWGDAHYYNYNDDCEDVTTYPSARFVSEHGFQSFPSLRAFRSVSDDADWSREGDLLAYRQRHPNGMEQVLAMVGRHFAVPPANATPGAPAAAQRDLFDAYLWLTQLQQARCYETSFATWRRLRAAPAGTMGVLYWQLNDVWQGPSWSTLEVDGSPRLAHYAAARSFAPLMLSATETDGVLAAHLTSDLGAGANGTLVVEVYAWADAPAAPRATRRAHVVAPARWSAEVWNVQLSALLDEARTPRAEAFVRLTFDGGASGASSAFHWLAPFKDVALPPAKLEVVTATQTAADRALITLRSESTAAFATVESDGVVGAFSDGAFTLLAGRNASVEFTGRTPFALPDLLRGLRLRSLADTLMRADGSPMRRRGRGSSAS